MSIVEFDGPPSWSLDVSETGDSTKCLWVGVVEGTAGGEYLYFSAPSPPRFNPTATSHGHLYSPQFRWRQETKMAARRTQRSTSTISRKNRGL